MPLKTSEVERLFGPFGWAESPRKGMIIPANSWVAANIVCLENSWKLVNPEGRLAAIRCHRLIRPKLAAVFNDLVGQNLLGLIRTYDGCFVPRHICWNPKKALSRHSWGIAVDINARFCPYGSLAKQPAKLVSAFRAHGFEWGGDWKTTKDPMHFECVRL
jgi:hypothetical protein